MPNFELEDTGPRVRPYPWEGRDFASINNVMLALVGAGDEEEAHLFMAEYRRFCGSAAVAEDNLRTIAAHMSDRYAREKVHLWFIAAPVRPIEYEYQDPPPAPAAHVRDITVDGRAVALDALADPIRETALEAARVLNPPPAPMVACPVCDTMLLESQAVCPVCKTPQGRE